MERHSIPPTPEAALNTQLAGVAVNGFLCVLSAMWLWLAGDASIGEMLIPLDSRLLLDDKYPLITIRWVFCINYSLVLMNLIPAAPFDGARIVKSILQLTLPQLDDGRIREAVAFVGRIVGLVLLVLALGVGQGDQKGLLPAWFPLTVLGLVALFAAEISSSTEAPPKSSAPSLVPPAELTGEDSSGSGLLDWEEGPFSQWLEEKREFERRGANRSTRRRSATNAASMKSWRGCTSRVRNPSPPKIALYFSE